MSEKISGALILVDRILEGLNDGFIRCEACGGQWQTEGLDCIEDLEEMRVLLLEEAKAQRLTVDW